MILILHHQPDDRRLKYAADFLFEGFSEAIELTNQPEHWHAYAGHKFVYGPDGEGLFQSAVSVLWSSETVDYAILYGGASEGIPLMEHAEDGPLDPLALTFWALSRIEEYQRFSPDQHGRFTAKDTAVGEAYRRPWLDELRNRVQLELAHSFAGCHPRERNIHYELTIDVDAAFAYRHKPIWRTIGAFTRDVIRFRFADFANRWKVLFHSNERDPYDTYLDIQQRSAGWERKWFFLLGHRSDGDLNIHHRSQGLHRCIQSLGKSDEIGIHPGYGTYLSYPKYHEQVERLEVILGHAPFAARQHYLRFKLPDTYRIAVQCGIQREYSMGFADDVGFRAGTSHTFYWFDVERNELTDLQIVPFCAMDATLRFHLQLNVEAAIQTLDELHQRVASEGGRFSVLWHNESTSEHGLWKGWKVVFQALMAFKR
ncbi:MAG: polysaccharide deacetylase family protein [Flavobacteriales bacterium]